MDEGDGLTMVDSVDVDEGDGKNNHSDDTLTFRRMNSGLTHTGNNSTGTNDSTQQEDGMLLCSINDEGKTLRVLQYDSLSAPNCYGADCDTDQETDRLLGEQRSEDNGFYDEKSQSSTGNSNSNSKQKKTNMENNNRTTTAAQSHGGGGSTHSTSNCNSSNSNQSSGNSSNTTSKEGQYYSDVLFHRQSMGPRSDLSQGIWYG